MASRCSSASLAASPASFQPSNAATTIVLCSSGREALPSGEVTTFSVEPDLGRGAQGKGCFSIDGLCFFDSAIADKTREPALKGHRDRQAGRVELGVQTSGDDVDFSGREALQRFSGPCRYPPRSAESRTPSAKEGTYVNA